MSEATIARLREENNVLREKLRQFEEIVGIRMPAPTCLMLTPKEAGIFSILVKRPFITKEGLMLAVYGYRDQWPAHKILDVFICKLRSKLEPFGIEIETVHGQGWRIIGASRAKAEELVKDWT